MKIFTFLLLLPLLCYSQKPKKLMPAISKDSIINKWVHAVINIEVRPSNEITKNDVRNLFIANKIDWNTQNKMEDSIDVYSPIYFGTAIFLKDNGNYFLLTARHVLYDSTHMLYGESDINVNSIFNKIILIENPTTTQNHNKPMTMDSRGNVSVQDDPQVYLMNISNVGSHTYELSSQQDDIGILNLSADESSGNGFIKTLLARGYIPITILDIDSVCILNKVNKIFVFGFPAESVIYKRSLPIALSNWESSFVSFPIVSTGVINYFEKNSNFFEAQIFTYHGFSGGPVVGTNNKLIGIIHGFQLDTVKLVNSTKLLSGYGVYHSRFMKSSLILPLLRRLESPIKR